jgi:hypothetical protein
LHCQQHLDYGHLSIYLASCSSQDFDLLSTITHASQSPLEALRPRRLLLTFQLRRQNHFSPPLLLSRLLGVEVEKVVYRTFIGFSSQTTHLKFLASSELRGRAAFGQAYSHTMHNFYMRSWTNIRRKQAYLLGIKAGLERFVNSKVLDIKWVHGMSGRVQFLETPISC